jgi:SEC-C motif-containing protein
MSKRPREGAFNRHTQTSSEGRYGAGAVGQTPPAMKISGEERLKAEKKPGRNKPCPCSSGRKFKKCCGAPKKTLEERFAAYDTMDEYPTMTPGYFANDATRVEDD